MNDDDLATFEADALAAEYALGLLTPEEAAAVEGVMEFDLALEQAVAGWSLGFAELSSSSLPRTPPDHLRSWIVNGEPEKTGSVRLPAAVRPGAWMLRPLLAALIGIAVLYGTYQAGWLNSLRLASRYEADFVGAIGKVTPDFLAVLDAHGKELTVQPKTDAASFVPPFGKTYLLWVAPADETTPVLLGPIGVDGRLKAPWPKRVSPEQSDLILSEETRSATPPAEPSRQILGIAALIPIE